MLQRSNIPSCLELFIAFPLMHWYQEGCCPVQPTGLHYDCWRALLKNPVESLLNTANRKQRWPVGGPADSGINLIHQRTIAAEKFAVLDFHRSLPNARLQSDVPRPCTLSTTFDCKRALARKPAKLQYNESINGVCSVPESVSMWHLGKLTLAIGVTGSVHCPSGPDC
jgi:hypothetical protein